MEIKITPAAAPFIEAACDDAQDSPESVDEYDLSAADFASLGQRVFAARTGGVIEVSAQEAAFIADRMRDEAETQRANADDLHVSDRRKLLAACRAMVRLSDEASA